jgi:hypothetical protein
MIKEFGKLISSKGNYMKKLLLILTLMCIWLSIGACSKAHTYGPYYGKVVDAETKAPIERAAVLVVFYASEPGPAGSISHYADAFETLTDKNGDFRMPEHKVGPEKKGYYLDSHGYFTIFRPGYGCYPWHKDAKPMFVPNGTLPAKKSVTIELPRLRTVGERLSNYGCYPSEDVPEAKYEKLFQMIQKEREAIGLEPRKLLNRSN